MATAEETYKQHNGVGQRGAKPHTDEKKQCQCRVCVGIRKAAAERPRVASLIAELLAPAPAEKE